MIKTVIIFLFFLSCQSTKNFFSSNESWIRKQWIVNTLDKSYLKTRIIQKTPTVLTSQLIIQGDSLYGIRAYDRIYGNLQWFFSITGGIEGGIHHSDKKIFFGGSDGFFYSLETMTGQTLWKFFTGSENLGAPFVYKNTVYFATSKGKVYALNKQTGKVLWIYNHPNVQNNSFSIRGISRPIVDEKKVYIGFDDGSFIALNKQTGRWVWKIQLAKKTNRFKDSDSHPVIVGNSIYTSSYDGGVFCLNKKTGKIVWKNEKGSYSGPVIKGRHLYYSSTDNHIIALNRFTGQMIWSQPTKSLATQPLIYKSYLIYGLAKGGLAIVNQKNGSIVYYLNLFRGISSKPVMDTHSNNIFIMSIEAWIYKLKLLI